MKNNNKAIVSRLTKRSLMSDKKRNLFIIVAIALTTLLLTFVFSVGMSFYATQEMQKKRLMGTIAHAGITHPSSLQLDLLKAIDYVSAVGTGNHVARVNGTPQMGDMALALYCYGKAEWTEMRSPAYTNVEGRYPQQMNEIMVPHWVLKRLNIEPQIGMEITITYTVEADGEYSQYDEVFVLSGWFTSYMHIRSGNIDSLLVSEELSRRLGKTPETDGVATVMFNDASRTIEYCEQLKVDLGLSAEQDVRPLPMYDVSDSAQLSNFFALAFVIVLLVFTGYLLIYNVLHISVMRDIRFYGLLKTIGTTPRQIRRIVTGQILRLCAIGIPTGLALASLLSLAVIPALVSSMNATNTGIVVSFDPLIYVGAVLFSLHTALLGAAKPAKKAASVSPIEAQKYTGGVERKSNINSKTHGKPCRMALRNIFRERRRASIVFISLFLGVTTFITITTLVSSMDTDNYISSYFESDFILTNVTSAVGSGNEPKQKFEDAFLAKIENAPGFESVQYDTQGWFKLTYTDNYDTHLVSMLEQEKGITPEVINQIKANFTCIAVGVDSSALTKLDDHFDISAFDRGEYLLFAADDPLLFDGIDSVEIRSVSDGEVIAEIPVGGCVPSHFHNNGHSVAPTLIMSNNLMEKLAGQAIRSVLNIDVAEGYDLQFLDTLKILTQGDNEISRESKIEAREEMRDTKMLLYILGGGIAFVIALIGVLNFVNVMSVSVMARKLELATLEAIGMSRRQTRKLLLFEGLGYAVITLIFVLLVGNVATYGIFILFQRQADYAVFIYPVIPVIITSFTVLAVCIITPEIAYRSINRKTIVERLREAE